MAWLKAQQEALEVNLWPDAAAYYATLPPLPLEQLWTAAGQDYRLLAAEVYSYICTAKREAEAATAAAQPAPLKSYTAESGMSVSWDTSKSSGFSAADGWCARASALREAVTTEARNGRRAALGFVSVPIRSV